MKKMWPISVLMQVAVSFQGLVV